ncbi:MAG: glycosyltransferase [Cyanobacteriota bacterium]|nr:glycosyltransferase [Cyanobacteriota bacterium]
MISKRPRISVVIPAYNCDRFVGQAVESVLTQTYSDYEIIVIDDGSQDNTSQVLDSYRGQIRYVYQENQGVSVARNHGLDLALGEFVAFLDADDLFLRDTLAAQLAVFEAKPNLSIVHSGWRRINQQGETLMDVQPWETVRELNLESWLRWKPFGTMGTLLFRRDKLEAVGGFQPELTHAEDVDLVLRLALKGCEAEWLRQSTVCYRQHDRNTMRDGISQAKSINWVLERFFSQSDVPLDIRLIESWVRYSTFVWSSWYLYYTGFPKEMVKYLQKSWNYTPFSGVETVINWMESFTQYSQNLGEEFYVDELEQLPEWQSLIQWIVEQTLKSS